MPFVSSQCQIDIPETIRNFLNITPGDEIDFEISGQQVILFKKDGKHRPFRKYIGYLSHHCGANPDTIINTLRGEADDCSS